MAETPNKHSEQTILIRNCMIYALCWTIICLVATFWNIMNIRDKSVDLAVKEARTILSKDQALCLWAADQNGIYVPATEASPPNPNLSHMPERDILTPSGRQLTLMNPAHVLQQVSKHYSALYGNKGQITSLKALTATDTNDEWEASALRDFKNGKQEASIFSTIAGEEVIRFMAPMVTKPGCLVCHTQQGFKEGDIHGGLSVTIPLAPYQMIETRSLRTLYATHLFFWASGLFILSLSFYRNKKRLMERLAAEDLLREQSEKIQLFAYSVAHDLKNPIIAIYALARILNKRHLEGLDHRIQEYCGQIEKSAEQVSALIDQINAFISSKEQPLKIEPLNLPEIYATIKNENSHRLAARGIQWSEPMQVATLKGDRLILLRIIRNLVDNALKYGGQGLSAITITHEESVTYHTIRVANDGKPLTPEDCRDIFQRYKRYCPDSKVEGTGLGLAIVRDLVNLHGGEVWVESDGKQGVIFSFTLAKNMADIKAKPSRK